MPRSKKDKKKVELNGDQPATQNDLSVLGGELTLRIDKVEGRIDEVEKASIERDEELKQEIAASADRIIEHFDHVVDKLIMNNHHYEQRLSRLEQERK